MKFLVSNYSCLQNPWLRGYRLQIPVLSVLIWICWTPPSEKNSWVRHCPDLVPSTAMYLFPPQVTGWTLPFFCDLQSRGAGNERPMDCGSSRSKSKTFLFSKASIPVLGNTHGLLHQGYSGRGVKLATHLHLALGLRMSGVILHSPTCFMT